MKNKKYLLLSLLAFLFVTTSTLTSCSKKTGCPINEQVGPKTNRKGQLSTKRGKTRLFKKKKRIKKRK